MNTILLRRVRRLFAYDLAPRHVQRHNMRQWCISMRALGARHILATPVKRKPVFLGEVA